MYCQMNLNKRRKVKKRFPSRYPEPLKIFTYSNTCGSMDFMNDGFMCGDASEPLMGLDDFNRKILAIEVALNLSVTRITRIFGRNCLARYAAKIMHG